MNKASQSKINATAGLSTVITALVGLAVAYDRIPAEAAVYIVSLVAITSNKLIMVFRTWYTG